MHFLRNQISSFKIIAIKSSQPTYSFLSSSHYGLVYYILFLFECWKFEYKFHQKLFLVTALASTYLCLLSIKLRLRWDLKILNLVSIIACVVRYSFNIVSFVLLEKINIMCELVNYLDFIYIKLKLIITIQSSNITFKTLFLKLFLIKLADSD